MTRETDKARAQIDAASSRAAAVRGYLADPGGHAPPDAPHPDMVAVVSLIAAERRALKLTQTDIAERSGISQPTISRIESGGSAAFSTIAAYARAVDLRLTVVALDGWDE